MVTVAMTCIVHKIPVTMATIVIVVVVVAVIHGVITIDMNEKREEKGKTFFYLFI